MTVLRRRVLRPERPPPAVDAAREARQRKNQVNLQREQESLERWMSRLKRVFHTVEKCQRRVRQLERLIAATRQA